MIFQNRKEAGQKLARTLLPYQSKKPIILALPRGGVPVGFEIARALHTPLDLLVVRKLGSPTNPEYGIGAIAPNGIKILDRQAIKSLNISDAALAEIETKELKELERRISVYRGTNSKPDIKNKTVILVDDGAATGITMKAAIIALVRYHPKKIIVAIPVCSRDAHENLRVLIRKNDELLCLHTSEQFSAVGIWYKEFDQVTDREVIDLLNQAKKI